MSKFDQLYSKLPTWAQNIAVSTYGLYWYWLRFGPGFKDHKQDFQERDRVSLQQWGEWSQNKVTRLLNTAIDTVPYYIEHYTEVQKQAAKAGDIQSLPLLEKDSIRHNPRAFLRQDMPVKDYTFFTSGTTGTPIASIWTRQEIRKSLALREVRSANWAGVSFSMPRATFSGRMVVPNPESNGPYYRYNAVEKQVYFSAFHLKPDTASSYVNAIWKFNIEWMTGYAVSYYLLAKYILEQGINVPPLKAVITTSEKLTNEMRKVMEQAYHCSIYEEYSTVETALFASECENGKLHVSPDAGYVEILRPDGTACNPGEIGEVVTTCLIREYQPLIRFRLGDLAAWSDIHCTCGRQMPVIQEVVGRIEDVVVGPDGRQMVRFHGIFTEQPNVREGQIIQESLNKIHVRVVPLDGFSQIDEKDIISRIKQRLGKAINVSVELVESIPRTKSGKFKAVISNLKK